MPLHRIQWRILAFLLCLAAIPSRAQAPAAEKPTLFYIPHTHWEGAVFKTREEYLQIGLSNILKAVSLLKKYPEYTFALDQVAYIKPFLERYPEEAAAFRKYVAEGRLAIVGGMDVMPDVVKPGGELFVRQMQYGKRWCRENLGVDVTAAWLLDTFGHHPQMPQLLSLAGYKSFWFCRGVPNTNMPSEFRWRGIDGTDIPAFWLSGFYGLFYGPPRDSAGFTRFFKERYDYLNPYARGSERVGLAGVDVSEPEDYVTPLVRQFNSDPQRPFTIRYSTPMEFAQRIAKRTDTPVLTGDFNPIFQGTYSSRIELKQATRDIEGRLLEAEMLGALAAWLGKRDNPEAVWKAWEPVLFNQTHDLASGVMTDHVYEDVKRGYDFSSRMADELIAQSWEQLADRIDTRGPGIPVVVFNSLGWPRTGTVEAQAGFDDTGVTGLEVLDPAGNSTPAQILRTERYTGGGLKTASISFCARNVPSVGYTTYRIVPKNGAIAAETAPVDDGSAILDNEYYRVTVDRSTGAITSLYDKALQWEALAGPANVIARQVDRGDLWELYHGLDGASFIAGTTRQPVPKGEGTVLSDAYPGKDVSIQRGPVFSEITVSHPFAGGSFATHIRLEAGVRRLDISTELVNSEKFVRYQALFPTSVRNGRSVQSIPFGAVERPEGVEYPAQDWVDYGDGQHGVALLNNGMPGNVVTDGTLMLSLLRAHTVGGYGFGGGFEPGMTSDSGYEIGRPLTFHYALIPHGGDWRDAGIARAGMEFNRPLVARKVAPHPGALPASWGMVEIASPNVILTSVKRGAAGSTILRLYEATGRPTPGVTLKLHAPVTGAWETNLLEARGERLPVKDDTVRFDLHPYEIKTIELHLSK